MGEPSVEDIKAAGLELGTEINFYNKGDNKAIDDGEVWDAEPGAMKESCVIP